MTPSAQELFAFYDQYLRRSNLGAQGQIQYHDGYCLHVGQWLYVASWDFQSSQTAHVLDELIKRSEQAMAPLIWRVMEPDTPSGLQETMADRGMTALSNDCLMAFDLSAETPQPRHDVQRIATDADLDTYLHIVNTVFEDALELDTEARNQIIESRETQSYVCAIDGQPVSAGQMDMTATLPAVYLRGGSTLPDFRAKGGYRALVLDRLRRAKAAGKSIAFTEARPTSRPILENLGFAAVCSGTCWIYRPRDT